MTRRRWIADAWTDRTATLHSEQADHLSRVLRARPGMEFDVVAGGHAWRACIASIDRDAVHFTLLEELAAEATLPVALLLSICKFDRMEWAIEKAVELGVTRIAPAIADRTEKHLAQGAAKRVDRWRRIALEAAKQSRRSDLPEIEDPAPLQTLLAGMEKSASLRILLAETEADQSLLRILEEAGVRERPQPIALAIGPEGGWTAVEVSAFAKAGWQSATLGPRILRVETAVTAALAVVSAVTTNPGPNEAVRSTIAETADSSLRSE